VTRARRHFWRRLGSRPIGRLSVVPAGREPQTSATYSFTTSRSWNWRDNPRCAASFLATTSTPDVPRSSRCTMPGRSTPPIPDRPARWWSKGVHERARGMAGSGMNDQAPPVC
jgi:hypothetical protein